MTHTEWVIVGGHGVCGCLYFSVGVAVLFWRWRFGVEQATALGCFCVKNGRAWLNEGQQEIDVVLREPFIHT